MLSECVHGNSWFLLSQGYSQIDGNLSTVAAGMKLNGTPNDLIQYPLYSWSR